MKGLILIHQIRVGARRADAPRLHITGVPETVKAAAVRAALDAAGWTLQFSEAGVAWANHTLAPERRWPETFAAGGRLAHTTWDQLTATAKRDSSRRITLPATPAIHAQLTLAARAAGVPLVVWALNTLTTAAQTPDNPSAGATSPQPAAPAEPPTPPPPSPARDDFEGMVIQLVRVSHPGVRTVEAHPGDWGIDAFIGEIVGEVTVWQSKYFIEGVSEPQKQQIRDSLAAAVKAADDHDYQLRRWVLCIPCSMDGPTTQWWDGWRRRTSKKLGVDIQLWDATELVGLLNSVDATQVRRAYYHVFGPAESSADPDRDVQPVADVAVLESALFIRQLQEAGHAELNAAKLQFFNADLMAREITDKGVPQELGALTAADATLHGLWETRFNEVCETADGRQLPGLHARVMDDVRQERVTLGPPLRATLVHLCGMVHRVVQDNRAGWVRDWRDVASSHAESAPLTTQGPADVNTSTSVDTPEESASLAAPS